MKSKSNYRFTGRMSFLSDGILWDVGFYESGSLHQILTNLKEFYKISDEQIVSITMRDRKAIKAQKEEALRNYNLSRGKCTK